MYVADHYVPFLVGDNSGGIDTQFSDLELKYLGLL